jgi:nucleoside-diphosphate-sugar epimerase
VDGILTATTHSEIYSQALDLGSGKLTSVRDMVESIVDIMQTDIEPDFGAIPDRFSEQPRIADVETTHELIGWKAKTNVETGLRKMVNWFKQQVNELKHAYLFLGILIFKNNITQCFQFEFAI